MLKNIHSNYKSEIEMFPLVINQGLKIMNDFLIHVQKIFNHILHIFWQSLMKKNTLY